jgi:hypothetical protein
MAISNEVRMRGLLLLLTVTVLSGCNLVNVNPGAFSALGGTSGSSGLLPDRDDRPTSPLHPVIARGGGEDAEPPKTDYDWVFFYYMAYDNNLEGCGRPILNMLKEGVTNDRVAVVTFADFTDKKGMKRYEATTAGEKETQLEVESSAHESTLKEQLEWTRDNYKADKYVIVFLDHGGALSEMSYDTYPGKGATQNWLHAVKVADVITEWRKGLSGKLEFVFIQQCGKGTLENFHAFRDAAPYVMASQTVVGAPNYYYTDALKAVCESRMWTGRRSATCSSRTKPTTCSPPTPR